MSVDELKTRSNRLLVSSFTNVGRSVASTALAGLLGAAMLNGCSANSGSGGGSGSGSGGTTGTGGRGGSSGSSGSSGSTGTGGTGAGTGGSVGTGGTSTGNGGTFGAGGSTGTGSSSAGTGGTGAGTGGTLGTGGSSPRPDGSTAGTGGSAGTGGTPIRDGGGDAADAAVCTNADMTKVNIDASGYACNNQWGIQGAWYCFSDSAPPPPATPAPGATSSCLGMGFIPYRATSSAMCLSGTTSSSTTGTYGAGIGLVLNQPIHGNIAKPPFNAPAKNPPIIGFAITISGNTGGDVLNISFPIPTTDNKEGHAVTVPGVAGTPITYNVLFTDAIIADNAVVPVPKIDPALVDSVEVTVPSTDGIAHTYDYCVTSIVPITAPPSAPAALTNFGPRFSAGKQVVLEGLGPYGIQNNPFGIGPAGLVNVQVQYGGGQIGFSAMTAPSITHAANTPAAFPSIISGWVHGGNYVAHGGYQGGKTIGPGTTNGLSSVNATWMFTMGTGDGDVAYDTWLSQAATNPINAGVELMVWLAQRNVQPAGSVVATGLTIGGTGPWSVSTGTVPNQTAPVVTYLYTGNARPSTLNLLNFFQEAAGQGRQGLASSWVLLSVQAGFEMYTPNDTWTTNSYTINIQ